MREQTRERERERVAEKESESEVEGDSRSNLQKIWIFAATSAVTDSRARESCKGRSDLACDF